MKSKAVVDGGGGVQLTWLFDNDGIPANWRKMNGFGVNTFKLINADGEENLCKFHCLPKGGESWFLPTKKIRQVEREPTRSVYYM